MNTLYPTLFVIALAVAATMLGMSGYTDAIGVTSDPTDGLGAPDALEEQTNGSAYQPDGDGGFEGSAEGGDESDIVGFIISGSRTVANFVGFVVLLPLELNDLGFPWWFAYPLGLASQLMATLTVAQFASNRRVR
jgi:hypothetical protein